MPHSSATLRYGSNGPALACVVLLALSPVAHAQEQGGPNDYGGDSAQGDGDNPNDTTGTAGGNPFGILSAAQATPAATAAITLALRDSSALCERAVGREYLVDCLGEQLDQIAQAMPRTGDYGDAMRILAETSTRLRALAKANAAPDKPRVRIKSRKRNRPAETRPLTPVRAQAVAAVNAQAARIVQESETKLLRAGGTSERRQVAYAQMAKAIGSNKTLLRSA